MVVDSIILDNATNEVIVTVSGNTGTVTYSWNGSAYTINNTFPASLGKHSIYIKDNTTGKVLKEEIMLYCLEEPKYNDSFTISYAPALDSFVSFHTYIPMMYIHTFNGMYKLVNNNQIYEAGKGGRGEYFGEIAPSYIDLSFNWPQEGRIDNVYYKCDVLDDAGIGVYNKGVDSISLRNSYMSSGTLLQMTEDFKEDELLPEYTTIKHNEHVWMINKTAALGINGKRHHKEILEEFQPIEENFTVYKDEDEGKFITNNVIVRFEISNIENYTYEFYNADVDLQILAKRPAVR